MNVNLVELTGNNGKKTKNELVRKFRELAITLAVGNHLFEQNPYYDKLRNAKIVSYFYQHEVLTLERSRLVEEYMYYNGFDNETQNKIVEHLDKIHGNERLSYRVIKGFKNQIKSLKQGLDYVDEYKYTHMDWNQTPILRESLPCE